MFFKKKRGGIKFGTDGKKMDFIIGRAFCDGVRGRLFDTGESGHVADFVIAVCYGTDERSDRRKYDDHTALYADSGTVSSAAQKF